MTQRANDSLYPAAHQPVPAFQSLLAIGAMLSTLAVISYACLSSDDSALRARIILEGLQVTLLTWAAGALASIVHLAGVAAERSQSERAPAAT